MIGGGVRDSIAGLAHEDYLGLQTTCRLVLRSPQAFSRTQVQICRLAVMN
jgi:hypothetical protein